ncbi:MAG: hypothetical protein LBR44_00610 [Clostridiales Family XIII bacterium]|jgi:hypothetical protein|nr:hypothetical protein [Clostridiales Family XIII bacterium]
MRRLISITAGRALGLALVAAMAFALVACGGSKEVEPQTVSLPDQGFSIQISGDWVDEAAPDDSMVVKVSPNGEDCFILAFELFSAADGSITEEDYLGIMGKNVMDASHGTDVMYGAIGATTVGADAIPAAQQTATAKVDGADASVLITVAHNDAYYFTMAFVAPTAKYEKAHAEFDGYLATVALEEVGAPEVLTPDVSPLSMKTVESSQGTGLTMQIPSDWIEESEVADASLEYASPGDEVAMVVIEDMKVDIQEGMTAEDYAAILADSTKANLEGMEEVSDVAIGEQTATTIAGAPAVQVDITYSTQGVNLVERLTAIAFETGDSYVQVTFYGLPSYMAQYDDVMGTILNSIYTGGAEDAA